MRGALYAYQALGWGVLLLGWPAFVVKALWDPRYRTGWLERFGAWGKVATGPVWVHGASVGEIRAAAPLLSALRARGVPLLVTATNVAGRELARDLVGEDGAARVLPLDLIPFFWRVFRAARPRALVLVETEIWPALLWAAHRRSIPVMLVNGRISDRTLPRYRRFQRWVGPLLRTLRAVQAQSEEDADRFVSLGAPRELVSVGGNLKFDLEPPNASDPPVRALRRTRAGGWRVVVGGSTHPGEEQALVRAADALAKRGQKVGLVLAPRHLQRLAEAETQIRAGGFGVRRWSALSHPLEAGILEAFRGGEAVLVDQYGLLSRLYGGGECAFVGGTLVPVGGHNLLEPLNWGIPVVFGPHTENSRDVKGHILRLRLGTEIAAPDELARAVGAYLEDATLTDAVRTGARELFEAHRGAARRALSALELLGALGPGG